MYYKVLAKCGHVGRNNYILKWFYIKAASAKEAAMLIIEKPRVKHNHKDVIRKVVEIKYDEYLVGLKIMADDKYFKAHSHQEQVIYNCIKQEDIYHELDKIKYKKERNGQILKYKSLLRESKKILLGGLHND